MPAKPYVFGTFGGGGGGTIAYVASERGAVFASESASLTYDSPNVTGSNRLGVITAYTANSSTITGVTWDGSAMTEVAGAQDLATGLRLQIFYIIAPSTGVTSVQVTASSNWNNMFALASCYTGVHQTTPIDTSGKGTGAASTTFSSSATTNNANEFVIDQIVVVTPGTVAATAPSTLMSSGNNGSNAWGSSYQSVAAAGSPTMAWTTSVSSTWRWNWISIKPV
jgi:hypothetical protein